MTAQTDELRCPWCDQWLPLDRRIACSVTTEYTAEERGALQKLHDRHCPSIA